MIARRGFTFLRRLHTTAPVLLALFLIPTASGQEVRAQPALPPAFAKTVPDGPKDLRAIQEHVKSVVARVLPATVGLRIGGASGSGVIIDAQGHVLTAGHVSGQPGRKVDIILHDGRRLKGITLGRNGGIDSGLVKITSPGEFPHVEMGDSSALKRGHWCLALGHPGGYHPGRAPVVRLGRILDAGARAVRTDCTLVGGDSGGPLFDMQGKVIGIHSRIGKSITFNIHVPANTYRETWTRLVASENWGDGPLNQFARSAGAYLGVRPDTEAKVYRIAGVTPGSPAEKAGLQADDVILEVDREKVTSATDLARVLRSRRPGAEVTLQIRRGAEMRRLTVVLGKRPA